MSSDESARRNPHETAEDVDGDVRHRIYDSVAWRWVVGPLVYIVTVAVLTVLVFDASAASGFAFGAWLAAFVVIRSVVDARRSNGRPR